MRLKGKLAVVTAAASGMGRAGCEIFAREGAKIAAVDIDQGRLDEVVEVVPHMRARGGGAIMFTASIAGLVGSMLMPVYSAAKFAVVGLTKSLAQTLAPDNIRVNVVCPGLTDTPMLPQFMSRGGGNIEESKKRYLAGVPMARVGRPEEMANAALWLASDEASYVTGVALLIDGGYSAK